jgi:hypothetical protein
MSFNFLLNEPAFKDKIQKINSFQEKVAENF